MVAGDKAGISKEVTLRMERRDDGGGMRAVHSGVIEDITLWPM